jgi:hypothetical protein
VCEMKRLGFQENRLRASKKLRKDQGALRAR